MKYSKYIEYGRTRGKGVDVSGEKEYTKKVIIPEGANENTEIEKDQ